MQTWINPAGAVTDPPLDHRDIAGDVCVAVVVTCLVSWLVLMASGAFARRALDRRRLNHWEAEMAGGRPALERPRPLRPGPE